MEYGDSAMGFDVGNINKKNSGKIRATVKKRYYYKKQKNNS